MTREEAIKAGYLEDTIVRVKPLPKGGNKAVKGDVRNLALFQFTGAVTKFELKEDSRGVLINPFKSDEERKFFEETLRLNLSVYDANSAWLTPSISKQLIVTIPKDEKLMKEGFPLNLADPWDNLRYRILLSNDKIIAPSWDIRHTTFPSYKYAIVRDDYEENEAMAEVSKLEAVYTFFGGIKERPTKLKEFLEVYLGATRKPQEVPSDADKKYLITEVRKIIDEDRDGFYAIIPDNNPDYDYQVMVAKGVKCGAIQKEGVNRYVISGEGAKFTYVDLIKRLKLLESNQDDTYFKIQEQIKIAKV